jgi:hypothetical protein
MFSKLDNIAKQDRKQQLFLRSMTGGNLAERDRLLEYTTGEFYQEFSLFITECQEREKEMEKFKKGFK